MNPALGVVAAAVALLAWGFGDFSIQRSSRTIGSLPTLFAIGLVAAVGLLPFALPRLGELFNSPSTLALLSVSSLVVTTTAIVNFEALRRGKIAVIEPVVSMELLITVLVSLIVLGESLSLVEAILIAVIFLGVMLTIIRHEPHHWWKHLRRRSLLEHGVILAGLTAIGLAATNIFVGISSQQTDPIVAIWFIHGGIAVFIFLWLLSTGQLKVLAKDIQEHPTSTIVASIMDNVAWVGYATAVTILPIAVVVPLTESYVVVAAFLGITLNKESLQKHQLAGMLLALTATISLAALAG